MRKETQQHHLTSCFKEQLFKRIEETSSLSRKAFSIPKLLLKITALLNSAPSPGYGHLPAFAFTWKGRQETRIPALLPQTPLAPFCPEDAPGAAAGGAGAAEMQRGGGLGAHQ